MHRKILGGKNHSLPRLKCQIGEFSGLYDKNDTPICWGDVILWTGKNHCGGCGDYGILLKNEFGKPTIYYRMWYGDNKFDHNSYGKSCPVPIDNGAKMHIIIKIKGEDIHKEDVF